MTSEPDARLTRIIARHFHDLQGLNTATIWMLFAAGGGVWLATHDEAATFLSTLVLVLAGACAGYWLERFYSGRFGRVTIPESRQRIGLAGFVALFMLSFVLTRSQWATFMCAVLAASSVWLLVDCWPYRVHQVFVIAGAGAAMQVLGWRATTGPDDIARAIVLVGSSMVIAGLADHVLLVRGMRMLRERHQQPLRTTENAS